MSSSPWPNVPPSIETGLSTDSSSQEGLQNYLMEADVSCSFLHFSPISIIHTSIAPLKPPPPPSRMASQDDIARPAKSDKKMPGIILEALL